MVSKLKEELVAKENIIKNETVTKVDVLTAELNQSRLNFETKIKAVENEKEREINRVYVRYEFFFRLTFVCVRMFPAIVGLHVCCRVKEAIKRKDEAIQALQSERDAALDQCSNMERMVERQRKELLKLK